VTVTYRLDDDNRFHMDWEAVTDAHHTTHDYRPLRTYVLRTYDVLRTTYDYYY